MMKLVDGPAKGTYMCKRAPLYLRAQHSDATDVSNSDVQLPRVPASDCKVQVLK